MFCPDTSCRFYQDAGFLETSSPKIVGFWQSASRDVKGGRQVISE